jgi:hypothetical protein
MAGTMVAILLAAQIAMADLYGRSHAEMLAAQRGLGAQVVVNLSEVPLLNQAIAVAFVAMPGLQNDSVLLGEAKNDQLSVFYPPLYRYYRHLGFPGK